ncbi:hypothetical protein MHZ93_02005 [Roseomonas sp. ACRSG]|nr:hypothetical protein [Roseomonas sp. ACRSG]
MMKAALCCASILFRNTKINILLRQTAAFLASKPQDLTKLSSHGLAPSLLFLLPRAPASPRAWKPFLARETTRAILLFFQQERAIGA